MSEFTIQSGIPMPEGGKHLGRTRKYPWMEMEVGDSFACPEGQHDSVRTAALSWTARHPEDRRVFSVRKLDNGTYRCWRIE